MPFVGRSSVPAPKAAPRAAPPPRSLSTGANPRGVAIQQVFHAQTPATQHAILRAAAANPQHPAAQALRGVQETVAKAYGQVPGSARAQASPVGQTLRLDQIQRAAAPVTVARVKAGEGGGISYGKLLGSLGHIFSPSSVYSGSKGKSDNGGLGLGTVSPMFGGLKGGVQVAKNAVSDIYNLPKQTAEGLYGVGQQLTKGHFGNAFHMFVDPFVHTFLHPSSSFYHHPVDTALQFAGPEAAVGRLAGGVARSGALGEDVARFANTAREPLRLPDVGGFKGPEIAARSYSRNLITHAGQKGIERLRGDKADVVTRPGFHIRRVANEMTAVRQMVGRTERGMAMKVMTRAAPHEAVRNVVSHVLQGVVRTPETAAHDIESEIRRLTPFAKQNVRSPYVAMAKRQVADLERAHANLQHLPEAFAAAKEIRPHLHASDAYLTRLGLLDGEQAVRRAVAPYAIAHMGATYDAGHGLVRGGNPLSTESILNHLKENKVPQPAYVGHYPGKVAPWRFYSAYRMARGSLGKGTTFKAFTTGGYDHTYRGLVAQTARTAEAIQKASLHDRIISRFGVKRPDGRDFTPVEARRFAYAAMHDENGNAKRGAVEYVPIARAPHVALDHVKDLQDPHELVSRVNEAEIAAVDRSINEVASRGDSKRNVVLVPKAAVDQFREQFKQQGGIARELGRFTSQFRRTVLPYSTHWMFQIGTEAGLRGLLNGVVDPRNMVAGHQLVRELEQTAEGRAKLAEMVNAVFYNQQDTLGIHHAPNPVLAAAHALPPTRVLIGAHNRYADFVGASMTRFEHEFRVMGLGKLARQDVQEFTRSWQQGIRLQGQNVATLAERLKADPNLVAKFGRQIDGIFGKYNKFSPKTRAAVQSFAPFLPWYLNAARFVLWHLPVKSPVASSLLASLRQTINQDVQNGKQAPLDAFSMEQLARLSPFGIAAYPTAQGMSPVGAMALKDATGVFLPQVEGSIYNLTGSNSFGEGALKGPNGDVKPGSGAAVRSALENFAEALLPGVRMAREAREGTASSYGTSTIIQPQGKEGKLGTSGVLQRLFNPLYSFEKAKAGAGAAGGSASIPGSGSGLGGISIPGSGSAGVPVIP